MAADLLDLATVEKKVREAHSRMAILVRWKGKDSAEVEAARREYDLLKKLQVAREHQALEAELYARLNAILVNSTEEEIARAVRVVFALLGVGAQQ